MNGTEVARVLVIVVLGKQIVWEVSIDLLWGVNPMNGVVSFSFHTSSGDRYGACWRRVERRAGLPGPDLG